MGVETKYGWFIVNETATGIMAEKFGTSAQFFVNDICMSNVSMIIQSIENEYECVHNIKG